MIYAQTTDFEMACLDGLVLVMWVCFIEDIDNGVPAGLSTPSNLADFRNLTTRSIYCGCADRICQSRCRSTWPGQYLSRYQGIPVFHT